MSRVAVLLCAAALAGCASGRTPAARHDSASRVPEDDSYRARYEETPGTHTERPGKHSTTTGRGGTSGEIGGGVDAQSGSTAVQSAEPVLEKRQREESSAEDR